MQIPFKKLRANATLPRAMSELSAGLDLAAAVDQPLQLEPGQRVLVPTGLACALPAGWEGQVRPRSGWALKEGVTVLNAPGTIDADYRGEICVILINHGSTAATIQSGQRIAQLVIGQVAHSEPVLVDELPASARSSGGFGSTGQ